MTPLGEGRILVLGVGAIGSSVGADLAWAGHDVTLADAWPAHIEAIRAGGLHVRMPEIERRVSPPALHLCDLAGSARAFDLVLLCSKSNDHRWLAELARKHMSPDAVLVGLQNGMNDASLAEVVGRSRVIGAVIELQAECFTPGQVKRNTPPERTWFAVGELDGALTPRLAAVADLLRAAARVDLTTNIAGAKWSKLIANCMTMGPFGLLGLPNAEAAALEGAFEVSCALGREALAVGEALGYRAEPVFGISEDEWRSTNEERIVLAMRTLLSHVGRGRTAPIHDHLKGRQSEIRFIAGVVCEQGRRYGIPTPANDAVVELDRRINTGDLSMEPGNFETLKRMIGIAPSTDGHANPA